MRTGSLAAAIVTLAAAPLTAQQGTSAALVLRLAAIPAPLGYEKRLADTLAALLPRATLDRAGNVIVTLGSGQPRRMIACPMDEPGWVVGGIREDGYLTVRRLPGRTPALFDQQAEGQRITLLGTHGDLPGVVGVRSVHLTRGRASSDSPFTADDAFVDVGASSADEARALGVRVTTPFVLSKAPLRYGANLAAAPSIGTRAACAALVRAASARSRGTVVLAFVVEQGLSARGLLAAATMHGPFAETLILGAAPGDSAVHADSLPRLRQGAGLGHVRVWRLRDRFDGWAVETVALDDVDLLQARLRAWIGGAP